MLVPYLRVQRNFGFFAALNITKKVSATASRGLKTKAMSKGLVILQWQTSYLSTLIFTIMNSNGFARFLCSYILFKATLRQLFLLGSRLIVIMHCISDADNSKSGLNTSCSSHNPKGNLFPHNAEQKQ